jgi:hypothetical protein
MNPKPPWTGHCKTVQNGFACVCSERRVLIEDPTSLGELVAQPTYFDSLTQSKVSRKVLV